MPRLNMFTGIGRLTREPELRDFTNSQLCTFTIAINNSYKNKAGEWEDDACFLDCKIWGDAAYRAAELEKGEEVLVVGNLKQEKWEDKEGNKKSKIVLNCRTVQRLQRKEKKLKQDDTDDMDF